MDYADGIYFNMPMEDYVAVEALGAHGIGKLLISPATFWADSWMNPTARKVRESTAMVRVIGSAYHCARLEPEHFTERYFRELDPADFPDALVNTDDIKAALIDAGAVPVTRIETGQMKPAPTKAEPDRMKPVTRTARKEDLVGQLLQLKPGAQIWDAMVLAHQEANEGRIPLSPQVWGEIEEDGGLLRGTPEVAAIIGNGFAEVSIIWTDEKGVRCKCRPDYLTVSHWLDLKTFSNSQGKHVEQAISDAFVYNRYHVGAAHYREGMELVRAGRLTVQGEATDEQRALVAGIQLSPVELACWYIFQEKAGIPNLFAKLIRFFEVPMSTQYNHAGASAEAIARVEDGARQPSLWFIRAGREVRKAKRLFRAYLEIFGTTEKWRPFQPVGELSDAAFRPHWLDEEVGE